MYPGSIRDLIECLKDLPGIGEKSAERMAFSILNFDDDKLDYFSNAISMIKRIKKCPICNNITDSHNFASSVYSMLSGFISAKILMSLNFVSFPNSVSSSDTKLRNFELFLHLTIIR